MPAPIAAIIATAIRTSEPEPFETDYSGIAFRPRLTAKMIAGRTSIAARIYRSFCTNGNGFLRGVRIEILSAYRHFWTEQSPIFSAFPTFHPTWREIYRRKAATARILRGEKNKQRRKPRESLTVRQMRCTTQNRAQRIESFRAKIWGKEKGRPEGRPSCSGCRNECRLSPITSCPYRQFSALAALNHLK